MSVRRCSTSRHAPTRERTTPAILGAARYVAARRGERRAEIDATLLLLEHVGISPLSTPSLWWRALTRAEVHALRRSTPLTPEQFKAREHLVEHLGSQLGTEPEQREITVVFAGAALLLLGDAMAASLGLNGRLP